MPKVTSPRSVPRRVSKPTDAAEAAARVVESAGAQPAVRKARTAKPKEAVSASGTRRAPEVATTNPAAATAQVALAKPAKAHKTKLVRDSFTIPKEEYAVLEALKTRVLGSGQHVRKSELLRAGIQALKAMDDRRLLAAVRAVPTLKTGRPKKG